MRTWHLPKIEYILERKGTDRNTGLPDLVTISIIESTLAAFGAPGKVVEVMHGPAVTWFGFKPGSILGRDGAATRIRTEQIIALTVDIGLALASSPVQIIPISGKDYVAIGIPKEEISPIALMDVMESNSFAQLGSSLRLGLGMDIFGNPVSCDLTKLPHLIISGTAGSGKSVCVNAIIACLLLQNTPDDLRLILADPTRVELVGYNGIPHLLAPVIMEMERVVGALQWMVREMDNRYSKLSEAKVGNITDFNVSMEAQGGKRLPYLLIVIDEVADLMIIARDEIERGITRLAQMGHNIGIHIILTTHRPSVDVLSGFIKASFPARIAFRVSSAADSRVILDQSGAEKLAGRGDMLFLAPNFSKPLRVQGVYMRDVEMERLVRYWRDYGKRDQ